MKIPYGGNIRQLIYLIVPTVVFYIFYTRTGIIPAMIVSLALAAAAMVFNGLKYKKITKTQVFGVIGLAFSCIAIAYTDNEKLYFVPTLIGNGVFAVCSGILSVRKRSVFHYVTSDFNLPRIQAIPENECIRLNYLWLALFLLRMAARIVGILYIDFNTLYWLVFLLGDPTTAALIAYSVYFINRKRSKPRLGNL